MQSKNETVFLSLTKSDFQDLIAETVNSCLKHNQPTNTPQQTTDELLTVQDAAQLLRLSVPTIYGLIHKGEIPMLKRSKRCYFLKADLIEYIKAGKKKTLVELANEADTYLSNHKKRLNNGK
jgi:excisionase family DNA binding protein